jgi:phosphomethylpyrimidine synthase
MTELEQARGGVITEQVKAAAAAEGISPETLRAAVAAGTAVICRNNRRSGGRPLAVGKGLRTKVNANIGSSRDDLDIAKELEKARVAVESGADALMDLSTGGPVDEIRRAVIAETGVTVGSVPIYQAALDTVRQKRRAIVDMGVDEIFAGIRRHLEDGVDFITVHCGVTRQSLERMRLEGRVMDVVSRGGAFLIEWMTYNRRENPLYEQFDRLLELTRDYDAVLSLGDGFRPGCLADATDRAQVQELILLGELTERAWAAGVQVMIEGPGHMPLDQIEANVRLQKRLCHGAPFYVLGPLVTDIAPGYDHITCAIGGAVAGAAGADFLCYVTPSEHLRLPTVEDVREGVVAARIAAHAADIAKGIPGAALPDLRMARARKRLDWEGQFAEALDPARARSLRAESGVGEHGACTMCGEFCAYKVMTQAMASPAAAH